MCMVRGRDSECSLNIEDLLAARLHWEACLHEKDSVNHETDIVLSNGSLASNGDGYLLEGMHICNLIYLQVARACLCRCANY